MSAHTVVAKTASKDTAGDATPQGASGLCGANAHGAMGNAAGTNACQPHTVTRGQSMASDEPRSCVASPFTTPVSGEGGAVDAYLSCVARRLGANKAWLVVAGGADEIASAFDAAGVVTVLGGTPVEVVDLRSRAASRDAGSTLVVDVTATATHGCAACRLGADVALSKVREGAYVVGIARGTRERTDELAARLCRLDAPSADLAAAIAHGDAARATCWRTTSDAAAVIAHYLRCHPAIARVRYPGLRDDPSFEVAARTLEGGFGATVSYATVAEPATWHNVVATADEVRQQVMELENRLSKRLFGSSCG